LGSDFIVSKSQILLLKEFLCDGPRGTDWHLYSALKFVGGRDDVLNQPV